MKKTINIYIDKDKLIAIEKLLIKNKANSLFGTIRKFDNFLKFINFPNL